MTDDKRFEVDPAIAERSERWQYLLNSYTGGDDYRKGDYLYRHERESEEAYERRKEQAVFSNLCAPVVDIYASYLFKDGINRTYSGIPKNLVKQLETNADLENRTWDSTWKRIAVLSGIYGVVGIIVDKPQGEALTKAEEIRQGIRPYLSVYPPTSFVSWKFSPASGFRTLEELVLREESSEEGISYYKVWTDNTWELWRREGDNAPEQIDGGTNMLGRIPFTVLRNRDVVHKMFGVSDITDVADLNRRIYYLDSDALEIIERTAFPFLEVPMSRFNQDDTVIGTGNVVEYDPNHPGARHAWVEPSHGSLDRILAWRNQAVDDIRATSKIAGNDAIRTQSGVALEIRFQQLNAILAEKADNLQVAEGLVLNMIADWEGVTWTGKVEYPKQFGVRDLAFDLDQAIKAQSYIMSERFNAEMSKNLAGRMLHNVGSDVISEVEQELDNPDPNLMDQIDGNTTQPVSKTEPARRK